MKWIPIVLIIAGGGLIGKSMFFKKKNVQPVVQSQNVTQQAPQRAVASVNPKAMNVQPHKAVAKRTNKGKSKVSKQEIEKFIKRVRKELGKDAYGVSGFVIFLRELAPQTLAKDKKLKDLCVTSRKCAMPLKEVYATSLARLDKAKNLAAKEIMQVQLLKSDLHVMEKQDILARNLVGTSFHKAKLVSKMKGKKKVQFGPGALYFLMTSKQLQALRVPDKVYLGIVFSALRNSNDKVARQLIVQGLTKGFPKFKKEIHKEAKKLKIRTVASIK